MESLEARRLDGAALSQEHYFQTLLEQARRRGLLTGEDERRIQLGCLAILREVAGEYALGDSSIRMEAAQNLFASISYTIGLALKSFPSPEEAAEALLTGGTRCSLSEGAQTGRPPASGGQIPSLPHCQPSSGHAQCLLPRHPCGGYPGLF